MFRSCSTWADADLRIPHLCVAILLTALISACTVYVEPAGPTATPLPGETPQVQTLPELGEPYRDRFTVELFADMHAALGRRPKVFQLLLTHGENGFRAGMYVTTGPAADDRSDRLLHIDRDGRVTVVKEGFYSNLSAVFAKGDYGEGMLISEPLALRIRRLLPDGTLTTFATLGTEPFGPAQLAYGPDDQLYVVDSSGKSVLHLAPDGSSRVVAKAAAEDAGDSWTSILFAPATTLATDTPSMLIGAYNFRAPNTGGIVAYATSGERRAQMVEGTDGLELLAFGPGEPYGTDIFAPTVGGAENGDGALYVMDAQGQMIPFLTGLDATSVAFDTEGILGGGMFVADINDGGGGGRIWRVRPREATTMPDAGDMADGPLETMEFVVRGEVNGASLRGTGSHIGNPWVGTNEATLSFSTTPSMRHTWEDREIPFTPPNIAPVLLSFRNLMVTDEPI